MENDFQDGCGILDAGEGFSGVGLNFERSGLALLFGVTSLAGFGMSGTSSAHGQQTTPTLRKEREGWGTRSFVSRS